MRIGELSLSTGVSIPTIRLYERESIIEPATRTVGGFREFSKEHEHQLIFIKRMRDLGFSLDAVRRLLAVADGAGDQNFDTVTREFIAMISDRKNDLTRLENLLRRAKRAGSFPSKLNQIFQ